MSQSMIAFENDLVQSVWCGIKIYLTDKKLHNNFINFIEKLETEKAFFSSKEIVNKSKEWDVMLEKWEASEKENGAITICEFQLKDILNNLKNDPNIIYFYSGNLPYTGTSFKYYFNNNLVTIESVGKLDYKDKVSMSIEDIKQVLFHHNRIGELWSKNT
jgi:hypothetical protein